MSIERELDEPGLLALAGELAQAWLGAAAPPLVVLLHGDLGAGKTTFTRGFLRGLGYEDIVKSPTYTLVEPYEIAGKSVYHFDLYRLADPEELEFTGARDYFGEAACLVEWPEKASGMLPAADIDVSITVAGEGRKLLLQAGSSVAKALMLQLEAD